MISKLDIVNDAVAGLGGPSEKPNRRFLTHLLASRVERALYERVEAAAAAEGRSMSGYVRKVLLDRLEEAAK